ncbi:type IV pilin protein [Alcanivorax sp. 24]|uniref:type IV pilin protein n=1 Tax=Alcanivorax sp. 24 TaxID=2545266 RepID=UPI00105CFC5D|nr:type IV pilin protein [Alcanivorax sp. 24]
MNRMTRNPMAGFTLIELMIVVVVVAILAAIAYPSYTEQVKSTRRAEYQGKLMDLAASLETYRARHFSYEGATAGGLAGDAYYNVQVATSNDHQSYLITATPHSGAGMAGDGNLKLNSEGQTCWVKGGDCTPSATSSWDR